MGLQIEKIEDVPIEYHANIRKSVEDLFDKKYDGRNSRMITYENLFQKLILSGPITFSGSISKYHIMIEENGKLGTSPFVMSINELNEESQLIKFLPDAFDASNYFIEFLLNNAVIPLSSVRYGNPSLTRKCNWGCRFGNCTKSIFDAFTDGNPGNATVGLLCVFFGPECAVSVGTICAVAATQGEFKEPISRKNPPKDDVIR